MQTQVPLTPNQYNATNLHIIYALKCVVTNFERDSDPFHNCSSNYDSINFESLNYIEIRDNVKDLDI